MPDLKQLVIQAVVLTLVFTALDFVVHQYVPGLGVPNDYFLNKLLFTPLIVLAALYFLPVQNRGRNLAVLTTLALSFRYYFLYSIGFVIVLFVIHYFLLYFTYWILWKKMGVYNE